MTKELQPKIRSALKKFIEKYQSNPNVIAILLSGSYVHSVPDKNSDLDVYILLEKSKMRERGNTWIDGIEIEYFINPVSQVKNYFKTETGKKAPSTAHIFANSIVLYRKNKVVDALIKEAKAVMKRKMPQMNKTDLELARYNLDDGKKDLEDVYLRKDAFAFNCIASNILSETLSTFFMFYRLPKEKPKRIQDTLRRIDKAFENLYSKAILETDMSKRFSAINKVVSYTEKLIGGNRSKEWRFVSKCTPR